jgi:hypothetical protein
VDILTNGAATEEEPRRRDLTSRTDPMARLERCYVLAKRRAWRVEDLGWEHYAPVPRMEHERWRLLWASVVQQQLQADIVAIEASTRLLLQVEHHEAKMYYTTMVQDEARHVEGWSKLAHQLDNVDAFNPYFHELSQILVEGTTLEEQVVAFQVVFEGAVIPAFRQIARAAEKTVLGEMAERLVRDDAIHHNSGVAYAEFLLKDASPALKKHIDGVLKKYTRLYIESALWRPPVRQWVARAAAGYDQRIITENQLFANKMLTRLGLSAPFDL